MQLPLTNPQIPDIIRQWLKPEVLLWPLCLLLHWCQTEQHVLLQTGV